jgi:hypothetical protein
VGLSACREIVEAHRGRIRVESTVGRGTAFTLRLPVWNEPSSTSATAIPLGIPQDAGLTQLPPAPVD